MLALTLTAGLPLPLRYAAKLTAETLERLLVRLPDKDAALPEQQLDRLIARQLFWKGDLRS